DDLVRGAIDRRPGYGHRSRAPSAVAERNPIGVAFDQLNVVDRQPETVRRDLAEGDFMALPVRMTAGKNRDLAIAMHPHHRAFPAAMQAATLGEVAARTRPRLVDEGSEADAHQGASLAQFLLLAPKCGVIRKTQELIKQGGR